MYKHSKLRPVLICRVCFFLAGCSSKYINPYHLDSDAYSYEEAVIFSKATNNTLELTDRESIETFVTDLLNKNHLRLKWRDNVENWYDVPFNSKGWRRHSTADFLWWFGVLWKINIWSCHGKSSHRHGLYWSTYGRPPGRSRRLKSIGGVLKKRLRYQKTEVYEKVKKNTKKTVILYGLCTTIWSVRVILDVVSKTYSDSLFWFCMNLACSVLWIVNFFIAFTKYRSNKE